MMKKVCPGIVFVYMAVSGMSLMAQGQDHVGLLLGGVEELEFGKSVPGQLEVGGAALGFLVTPVTGDVIGAAGALGQGRVVAFAHGSFLKGGLLENDSGVRLVSNSVRWSGRGSKVRVGVPGHMTHLSEVLAKAGLEIVTLAPRDVSKERVDVYCMLPNEFPGSEEQEVIRDFVRAGGGLVLATTPWAYAKEYPEFEVDFPGNRFLEGSGVVFLGKGTARTGGTMAVVAPGREAMSEEVGEVAELDVAAVLAARRLAEDGGKIGEGEREDLIVELQGGLELEGEELLAFRDAMLALDDAIGPVIPTLEEPVSEEKDALAFAVVRLQGELLRKLPAAEGRAIAAAEEYPGGVPGDAKRVTEMLRFDVRPKNGIGGSPTRRLESTGLYAPAGETITVRVPRAAAGKGFGVSVGAYHIPLFERKDKWQRYPVLMREFKLEEAETAVSFGMGGLITIAVPRDAGMEELEVTIEGAVRAPLFELGKTSVEEWRETIRDYPAPWAEIGSSRIVYMLPSEFVRDLDNPDEVMAFWTKAVDMSAELLVIDRDEIRPERVSVERQLALGALHSGYPIGAHIKGFGETVTDLDEQKRWGIFHELGHNHQRPMWYLPGTTETTCNLWSVLLSEDLMGTDRSEAHRAMGELDRRQRLMAYVNGGKKFEEDWSVWTALEMYLQLQEAFGWEAYREVFDEYNRLPSDERPKEQQDKNDQWMIRFSKAVDRNLGPFFRAWNIPVTEAALAEVSGLPEWKEDPMVRHR
ncbi:MAG: M60 family metallopeptidase [Verrucomicrobiota bacterium]